MAVKKVIVQEAAFKLFGKFIAETSSGKRLKKNGKKIRSSTVENYDYTLRLLKRFCQEKNFDFKMTLVNNVGKREFEATKKYWKKFYDEFTNYLYNDLDYYDNYVGHVIKSIRAFFNYLKDDKNLDVGTFHKSFYKPHEEIEIIALSKDQLLYLITDTELNTNLPEHIQRTRDRFVFGCTVALRQGDLSSLTQQNLFVEAGSTYLRVFSGKTGTFTAVKLPDYAVEIINRNKNRKSSLFPEISKGRFNKNLKELAHHLKYDQPIVKKREKRGKKHIIYKDPVKRTHHTLADFITTHTMRRTGITNLLRLGMPDYQVRQISGHAANSKEFYRYVQLAQSDLDKSTDLAFDKLLKKD